jgi:hypothetical protein
MLSLQSHKYKAQEKEEGRGMMKEAVREEGTGTLKRRHLEEGRVCPGGGGGMGHDLMVGGILKTRNWERGSSAGAVRGGA